MYPHLLQWWFYARLGFRTEPFGQAAQSAELEQLSHKAVTQQVRPGASPTGINSPCRSACTPRCTP